MEIILKSIISLGGMGLLFGLILAFASKKFEVETDPKSMSIRELLPGANCGACGYVGCDGYAEAAAQGQAPVDGCPVGGSSTAEKIAEIMGVEVSLGEKKSALVLCQGDCDKAFDKYDYQGIYDCTAASMLAGGLKGCVYGCLGFGTCVKVCPFDAIHINDKKIAVVDEQKCKACGMCVTACPKNLIELVPQSSKVRVLCKSTDKGRNVKSNCKIGCIGCQICVKACKFDAIEFVDNLAKISYDKCVNCMVCAEKCPTGAIFADFKNRKTACIDEENCIGCSICKKACVFEAIEGEHKQKHKVLEDKCTGCKQCISKCPVKAINMTL